MHLHSWNTLRLATLLLSAASRGYGQQSLPTVPLATSFPDPNVDPFYQAPSNITSYAPGDVIRSRQVFTTITGRAFNSYQVFYRTYDNLNNSIGSVSTIWVPGNPISPPKIFSFPQAEDSVNLDCAPSWAWVNGSSVQEAYLQTTSLVVQWALNQGYYVVVSDAEGPDSAWLVGRTEGRTTLDGIRTTIDFLDLPAAQTEATLLGYSGGAHTSVWASSLAESYAPELNIVGAAYGGTPVDLRSAYNLLNASPGALLAGGALVGLANGYPNLNSTFNSLYTANGSAIVAQIRSPNFCIPDVGSEFAGFNFSSIFTGNILTNPVVVNVLAQESLLSNVSSFNVPVPKFPRFQFHGTADTTVPYAPEAAYVQQQCAAGADIRFTPIPGENHAPALISALPGALQFIAQAFDGTLQSVTCGSNVTLPAIGSATAIELLGVNVNVLLEADMEVLSA